MLEQDNIGRQYALCSYWLIFLIGLPLWYYTTTIPKHPLPFSRIQALSKHRSQAPDTKPRDEVRVKGYPGYQLAFTVISASDLKLDLQEPFARIFSPRLNQISDLAFFKVDLQHRLYCTPSQLFSKQKDPAVFVNGAWNLGNSISSLPILNFVLFVDSRWGGERTFMYPQWGSVYVVDGQGAVDEALETFWGHLVLLLGTDKDKWYERSAEESIASAVGSLNSLLTILKSNPNIPIPLQVSSAVTQAVCLIEEYYKSSAPDLVQKYGMARNALDYAESAFFHPAMLGRQYFPQEHKLAVYVPLFVPLLIPLFVQTLKTLKP